MVLRRNGFQFFFSLSLCHIRHIFFVIYWWPYWVNRIDSIRVQANEVNRCAKTIDEAEKNRNEWKTTKCILKLMKWKSREIWNRWVRFYDIAVFTSLKYHERHSFLLSLIKIYFFDPFCISMRLIHIYSW